MINVFLTEQLIQLINQKTGLAIRDQDRERLCQKIIDRTRCLRMPSVEDYYRLLTTRSDRGDREWETLIDILTTGESYFFRDRGQIQLLRNHLLPELIHKQRYQDRDRGGDRPSLNIWSAGCSTGEEVYSLAILLMELLPDWRNWDLQVLGTDINALAIAKAKTGLYNDWSFRLVEPRLKNSYFQAQKGYWKINPDIQQIVDFQTHNLILDAVPKHQGKTLSFDLVICRNVFIYLTKEAIDICLGKFCHALKNNTYLITSHTELYGHNLNCLQVKVLPESIVYQKKLSFVEEKRLYTNPKSAAFDPYLAHQKTIPFPFPPAQKNQSLPSSSSVKPYPLKSYVSKSPVVHNLPSNKNEKSQELESLFNQKDYTSIIKKSQIYLQDNPKDFITLLSIAKSYANLGQLDRAIHYANECLSVSSFAIDPYYLLAQIAEEKGELEQAKLYLKRIVYLEPNLIPAYLDLASLYAQQGNKIQARKFWNIALDLLQKHPQDAKITASEDYSNEELLMFIKKCLKELQ